MYVLINPETMKFLRKVSDYRTACILPDIEYPLIPTHAIPLDGKRSFSKYTAMELVMLCRNAGIETGVLEPYNELCGKAFAYAEAMELDKRTYAQLDAKAGPRILPSDDPANAGKYKLPPPLPQACAPEREPGQAPPLPKAAKAPSAPRTKGATGMVWDICNGIYADLAVPIANWKEFRESAKAKCVEAGINEGTFGVQFGKWKSSKG